MTKNQEKYLALIEAIARMRPYDGTDSDPSDDDAIETLNSLIREAQELVKATE